MKELLAGLREVEVTDQRHRLQWWKVTLLVYGTSGTGLN